MKVSDQGVLTDIGISESVFFKRVSITLLKLEEVHILVPCISP